MQKIFTFLIFCIMSALSLSAQKPTATIPKASVAPVIGGDIDAVWEETNAVNIDKVYINENPTVGEPGETYWKGLWANDGIYILVYVADDDYYSFYQRVDDIQNSKSRYDQVEIYFDCNFVKEDGLGGWEGGNAGHYKFAPATGGNGGNEGFDDGTMHDDYFTGLGYQYSINASSDPHYFVEYFVPFSSLKDSEGNLVDIAGEIGFEVAVIDNDSPGGNEDRHRVVWANNLNGSDDSWDNMNDAGIIYLEGVQDCIPDIILTGGEIDEDNEPFHIGIEACPEYLIDGIKWVINEDETTAIVRVSDDGIVTPITNGVLKILATSSDGYAESNEITVYITGQRCRPPEEMSWLIDGNNDMPNEDGLPNNAWVREDGLNNHTAFIEDGVFRFYSDSVLSAPSAMKIRQVVDIPLRHAEEEFMIGFTMWAETETSFQLVLEDRNNNWAHWGIATDTHTLNATPIEGNSRWNLTVTTEPQRFRMNFIPSNIKENSILDFSFQLGLTNTYIQMDSLYLFRVKESEFVDWDGSCLSSTPENKHPETLHVYPNPVTDRLNLILSKGNTTVTIFNSLGFKIKEVYIEGIQYEIDVSNYSTGIYFVKANNNLAKFVK